MFGTAFIFLMGFGTGWYCCQSPQTRQKINEWRKAIFGSTDSSSSGH